MSVQSSFVAMCNWILLPQHVGLTPWFEDIVWTCKNFDLTSIALRYNKIIYNLKLFHTLSIPHCTIYPLKHGWVNRIVIFSLPQPFFAKRQYLHSVLFLHRTEHVRRSNKRNYVVKLQLSNSCNWILHKKRRKWSCHNCTGIERRFNGTEEFNCQ